MAMMKKATRRIVVDGTAYRYRILALDDSGCCGRCDRAMGLEKASYLKLSIELASAPAQLFQLTLRADLAEGSARPITPANVAHFIRNGLRRGWNPGARTPKTFHIAAGA